MRNSRLADLPVPAWRITMSRAALAWERLWVAAWPALALIGGYLVLALLDVLPELPGWLHAAILLAFVVGLGASVWQAVRTLRLPDRQDSLRRMERVNELDHRPLETLQDSLASGWRDEQTQSLWRLHQQRMRDLVSRLRVGWPHPKLVRRDPYALRIGLSIAVLALLFAVGDSATDRIARALTPNVAGVPAAAPARLDAWITPPEYTRTPPVFLASGNKSDLPEVSGETALEVPRGSKLVARITGGHGMPKLETAGAFVDFAATDDGGFEIEESLIESGRIVIKQADREVGSWQVTVTPDNPPTVAFVRPPSATQRKALRLDVEASDDYGIDKVVARITRSGALADESAIAKLDPIELELAVPGGSQRQLKASSFHDLTPHAWAGLPVNIQLKAHDAIGQTASSKVVQVVLPERVFSHPVARAIIAQRRQLILYPAKNRDRVAANLEIIAWEYEKYNGDTVVFLALSTASRRIGRGALETPKQLSAALQLLWDTALRVEDGTLSLSERSLREAQQALQDALDKGAPDAELERLLKELERAMDEYLRSLAESMRNNPQQPNELQQPMDPRSMMLSREDLKKMLDRIRELYKSGQREAARQMLSQLRNMLENLRARRFQRPGQQHRRAMKMLDELQGIIREQQKLLDKTFREAQRRGQMRGPNPSMRMMPRQPGGQQPPGMPQENASPMDQESQNQEALRRRLGELMRQLGEMSGKIPRPFGQAERSMRDSTTELEGGQAGRAVPPQTKAIDQLQQGARAATQQLMQQLGRRGQRREGDPTMQPSEQQRDPFGRNTDNAGQGMNTEDVQVPDGDDVRDARRIRDELRRRAGQRTRPRQELDYIERLLKQF